MLAMIKKQLVQAMILLGVLCSMMVLGGMFEGGLGILTGLCALALLGAILYGLTCLLDACSRTAKRARSAQVARHTNPHRSQHPENLQIA